MNEPWIVQGSFFLICYLSFDYYNTKIIKDDYLLTMNYKDYSTDDDENTIYNDYDDTVKA